VRGQTGKGANHTLFGGAFLACVAGGQTGWGCLFRTPFLWFVSFGGAKEMNIIQKKKEGALLRHPFFYLSIAATKKKKKLSYISKLYVAYRIITESQNKNITNIKCQNL